MSANIVNFNPKVAHTFSMVTTLRGLDDLRFVPSAKQVSVTLNSPWQHPYFIGRYLPDSRTINKEGFNAHWNMSEFSTSIKQTISACADNNDCFDSLYSNSFGVGMHNPIDIYQKTDRSLKYAFLFIMLTFVVFCLFETIISLPNRNDCVCWLNLCLPYLCLPKPVNCTVYFRWYAGVIRHALHDFKVRRLCITDGVNSHSPKPWWLDDGNSPHQLVYTD